MTKWNKDKPSWEIQIQNAKVREGSLVEQSISNPLTSSTNYKKVNNFDAKHSHERFQSLKDTTIFIIFLINFQEAQFWILEHNHRLIKCSIIFKGHDATSQYEEKDLYYKYQCPKNMHHRPIITLLFWPQCNSSSQQITSLKLYVSDWLGYLDVHMQRRWKQHH